MGRPTFWRWDDGMSVRAMLNGSGCWRGGVVVSGHRSRMSSFALLVSWWCERCLAVYVGSVLLLMGAIRGSLF